jgi:DNA-binding transcriptional regulator YbjK
VPPFNAARRDRLADAAIEILARDGTRGLTHRAVDGEAGEPPGTTSRYFRSREALLIGAAERARALHFADLERAATLSGDPAARLAVIVQSGLTANRSRHLAALELFLESTRLPRIRETMSEIRATQVKLIQSVLGGDEPGAVRVTAALTGLVLIGLTTPHAIGLHSAADAQKLVGEILGSKS